ncbi:hypothetical protein CH063_12424 [Colletotrichum higginsianum]|uniref:Uncharacterized protein n=1 Tax=Colletotrichum higginsianum (strain IMI 349063) TaxID=759273 RepID=H1VQB7_COLHI|nr:hypothetical protein CH063_12424 [Colletotrichum higginsianum]
MMTRASRPALGGVFLLSEASPSCLLFRFCRGFSSSCPLTRLLLVSCSLSPNSVSCSPSSHSRRRFLKVEGCSTVVETRIPPHVVLCTEAAERTYL